MTEYTITPVNDTTRCRWVYDEDYRTQGSYAYDTDEETRAAEIEELTKLERGDLVVLGCIVEHLCAHCGTWSDAEGDSLWGIVIEPNDEHLQEFAKHSMELER